MINDHAIKGDLSQEQSVLYSGASKDFFNFTQENEQKSYDAVREENGLLRDALVDLQQMVVEVAEHRHQIVSSLYDKQYEVDTPAVLKELKSELFNLTGSSLGRRTLTEIRDNISKFKEYMAKLDNLSIIGTNPNLGNQLKSSGLEQIPSTCIQAENLV